MGPDPRTRVPWSCVISLARAHVSEGPPHMGFWVSGPDLVTLDTGGEAWSRDLTLGTVGRGRRTEAETVDTVARLPGEE